MRAKQAFLSMLVLSFIVSFAAVSSAQLGEQAGQPNLNVSLGSTVTFNYSVLNSGSSPINFTVILPVLNTIPHNTTPTVTVTPMGGVLQPHSQQVVSIKVYMPSGDKVGLTWQGVLQVVEGSYSTSSSGGASAVITAGVAKILTIHSTVPKGLPIVFFIAIAILIVAISGGSAYYFFVFRNRKAAAAKVAAAAEARHARAKRAVIAMKRKRAVAKKGARKPARKKAAGRRAGARTHSPRRRRRR